MSLAVQINPASCYNPPVPIPPAPPPTGDITGGVVGPAGPPGPPGPQGADGSVGPQGLKGDTGDTGATGATGPMGPEGPMGPQGPIGPEGPIGRSYNTFEFTSDYTNFIAPPAPGTLRFNNSNRTLATKLWVSDTNLAGVKVRNYLGLSNSNDSIYVQTSADADRYQIYTISAQPLMATGYVEYTIHWDSGGSLQMTNAVPTLISIVQK